MAEEDRRKKLPANWEAMQRREEWENKEEEARKVLKLTVCCLIIVQMEVFRECHCIDIEINTTLQFVTTLGAMATKILVLIRLSQAIQ